MEGTYKNSVIVLTLLLFLILCNDCSGGRILIYPLSITKNSLLRNLEKLSAIISEEGGHEIHVLAHDGYQLPPFLVKLGAKHIKYSPSCAVGEMWGHQEIMRFNLSTAYQEHRKLRWRIGLHGMTGNCESILKSTTTMDEITSANYDLLLVDPMDIMCSTVLSNVLKTTPVIKFYTFDIHPRLERKEYPYPASYLSFLFSPDMTFLQRTANVLMVATTLPMQYVWQWKVSSFAKDYGIEEIAHDDSLYFVLGGFPMEDPAPSLPDTIQLNGALVSPATPLSVDLENFFAQFSDHGVVLISFGSLIVNFDERFVQIFIEAFRHLPYGVLWKYEGTDIKDVPSNVQLMKWIPQASVLADKRTKIFVTHCGINSIYETVHYKVPIVAIPVYGDQFGNAQKATDFHKIGIRLDLHKFTSKDLSTAIRTVAEDRNYKSNVTKLSNQLLDKPLVGRSLIMYWVNYMIRHGSASHMKAYGRNLPLLQFYLLDVFLFLLIALVILMALLGCCCRASYRKCCKRQASKTKSD